MTYVTFSVNGIINVVFGFGIVAVEFCISVVSFSVSCRKSERGYVYRNGFRKFKVALQLSILASGWTAVMSVGNESPKIASSQCCNSVG
jgi:hypothetical protein